MCFNVSILANQNYIRKIMYRLKLFPKCLKPQYNQSFLFSKIPHFNINFKIKYLFHPATYTCKHLGRQIILPEQVPMVSKVLRISEIFLAYMTMVNLSSGTVFTWSPWFHLLLHSSLLHHIGRFSPMNISYMISKVLPISAFFLTHITVTSAFHWVILSSWTSTTFSSRHSPFM